MPLQHLNQESLSNRTPFFYNCLPFFLIHRRYTRLRSGLARNDAIPVLVETTEICLGMHHTATSMRFAAATPTLRALRERLGSNFTAVGVGYSRVESQLLSLTAALDAMQTAVGVNASNVVPGLTMAQAVLEEVDRAAQLLDWMAFRDPQFNTRQGGRGKFFADMTMPLKAA